MTTEAECILLGLIAVISVIIGIFIGNVIVYKRKKDKILSNKKKIKLVEYLKRAMYRYPEGGLCHASDMLFVVQIVNRTERDILHDIIAEFKPDKT